MNINAAGLRGPDIPAKKAGEKRLLLLGDSFMQAAEVKFSKTTGEILSGFSLFPQTFTLENYQTIFTDPTWYWGYINSILYVSLNTVISVTVALPAAYAFSRYRFLGDKQLFFWLLTNRMAPAAVFGL